ncbi:MAG: cytochrome P450 [Acidimicrobiales bacterium]
MGDDAMATDATVRLNPFAPEFLADPYAQYAALREAAPVHRTDFGPWLLTRWQDVHHLLRNPSTSVEDAKALDGGRSQLMLKDLSPERAERGTKAILNIDPPDHDRLRRLVSKAFTPRTVEQLRPRIEGLVANLLDEAARQGAEGDGRMDVIAGLAFPLPFAVISEMLGMPDGDTEQLRDWSHTLTQVLDPILALTNTEAIFEASDRMTEVLGDAIAWKRARPDDDDLLNALIRAEDGGDVLSERELIDNVSLLFLAGHETTVNLIGNGTLALLRHRVELERLVADPGLDSTAVDELLRYDSPVQFSRRIVLEPLELEGQAIEAGEMVLTGLGAANRDPAKFGPDADELRLDRVDANQHVSFGSGVHHCLGAALARLEGRIAIGALVRRFPAMELVDEEPAWNGRMILRGLDRLEIGIG